jgi:hypothetical protein
VKKLFIIPLVLAFGLLLMINPLMATNPPPAPPQGQCAVNIDVDANGALVNATAGPAPCPIFARAGPVWGPNAGGRGEGGCSPIGPAACLLHASGRAGISGQGVAWADSYVLCHSDGKQYFVQIGQPILLYVSPFAQPGTFVQVKVYVEVCGNVIIDATATWDGVTFDATGWEALGISWDFDGKEWKAFCYGKTDLGFVDPSCQVHLDLYVTAQGNGMAFAFVG